MNWLKKIFKRESHVPRVEAKVESATKVKVETEIDRSDWTGKDFEFLIRGVEDARIENYDEVMTPNSMGSEKFMKDDWPHYRVDNDDFNYSWEMPGIQMVFNPEVKFGKAKRIVDEVIENLEEIGHEPNLLILNKSTVYRL